MKYQVVETDASGQNARPLLTSGLFAVEAASQTNIAEFPSADAARAAGERATNRRPGSHFITMPDDRKAKPAPAPAPETDLFGRSYAVPPPATGDRSVPHACYSGAYADAETPEDGPNGCVLDKGCPDCCAHTNGLSGFEQVTDKWDCEHWRPLNFHKRADDSTGPGGSA